MKRFLLLLLMVWAIGSVYAQEENRKNEVRTLFSDKKSFGFYGGMSIGYSRINGQDALVSGGRGALIFNHSTAVGMAGYGFVNNVDGYRWDDENTLRYSLAGGYGGIFIEPILGGLNPVHLSFPVLFGIGGISQIRTYGPGYWEFPYFDTPESDLFFIVEPAAELEVNLTKFFRTALTLSYRYTTDIELFAINPDVLRGVYFGITFKVGKF